MEKTEQSDEQLDQIETFGFRILTQLPTRNGEACSMCMICEESCPTGAMDAVTGQADGAKCIACLACWANCPDDALKINDMSASWTFKLEMGNATEESIKGQR